MRQRQNYWTNLGRRRANRRTMLKGTALGVGGLGALSLVGCGNDDDDDGTAPPQDDGNGNGDPTGPVGNTSQIDVTLEEYREIYHGRNLRELPGYGKQPQRGGDFRFAFIRPTSWDPTGAGASTLPSYAIMHNQLLRFGIGEHVENLNFAEVETDLAQSMPEQSDELTYIFKIHPNATFHDTAPVNGRALTAEDVKYAIEVYQTTPVQSANFAEVSSMDVPDDETLVITTSDPAAYFINSMVIGWNWIFSREQHESGSPSMDENPIGTGPFMLESMEDVGGFKAVRNPNYWKEDAYGTQLPYWDSVEYRYIPSPVDADAAFRTGEIDHRIPTNYDAWKQLVESNPNVVTQVTTPPPSAHPFILMNLNQEPFNDVRVRRALALAVDRDAIIDALAGGMAEYSYGLDHTYFGFEWAFPQDWLGDWHRYDPDLARQLLADAGYPDGIPRTLEVFTSYTAGLWFEVAVATFNMWSQIGVNTDHQYSQDQAQWISRYFQQTYDDMMSVNFVGPGWDPDAFTYQALHSESPRNYFHVNNPELDELALAQRREMDVESRQEIIRQIMDIDLDEVYRIWLVMTYKINLRYPYVQNLTDAMAAWAPVGWGSHNLETGWFDEDQRA